VLSRLNSRTRIDSVVQRLCIASTVAIVGSYQFMQYQIHCYVANGWAVGWWRMFLLPPTSANPVEEAFRLVS